MEHKISFGGLTVSGIDDEKESMVFHCFEPWGEKKKVTYKLSGNHEVAGDISNVIGETVCGACYHFEGDGNGGWKYFSLRFDNCASISVAGNFMIC